MKLSEKLAAAGDGVDEDDPLIEQVPRKVIARPKPSRASLLGRTGRLDQQSDRDEAWSNSKRQVQQMVLTEVAPSAGDLEPDQLWFLKQKTAYEILEREDIGISPT